MATDIKACFPFFKAHGDAVWLDGAATAQKPACLSAALTEFYNKHASNVYRGEYPAADEAARMFESARSTVAGWFGAKPERTAFTANATDSLNVAADILGRNVRAGDNVIVSPLEHNSALLPWMRLCGEKKAGLRFIPLLSDGTPDLSSLPSLTDARTRAAVVTAGSNVNGWTAPLQEIGGFFSSRGVPLVIDAAQAAPHRAGLAEGTNFAFLCASAHKIYGPDGLGILISGGDLSDTAGGRIGGGTVYSVSKSGYERKPGVAGLEAGTPNVAGAVAFAAVIDWLSSLDLRSLFREEERLAALLREKLISLGMRTAPGGASPLPVVSFDPGFMHPLDAARLLGSMGICVRAGKHCAHIAHDALGFSSTLRASFGIYNTESDVERLADALKFLKGRYGNV